MREIIKIVMVNNNSAIIYSNELPYSLMPLMLFFFFFAEAIYFQKSRRNRPTWKIYKNSSRLLPTVVSYFGVMLDLIC